MNREEARKRRRLKQKRANRRAVIFILSLLVLLFVIIKIIGALFSSSSSEGKTTSDLKPTVSSTGGQEANEEEPTISKEEKEKIEKERKEKYGEFYVPLPDKLEKVEDKSVKGLYITESTVALGFDEKNIETYEKYIDDLSKDQAGHEPDVNILEKALAICNKTEINALVINVKTDDGFVVWNSDIEVVNKLKSSVPATNDNYKTILDYMKKKDIYPIARVVAFKDTYLPNEKPEHAMQLKDGTGIYKDNQGNAWVNQFDKFVWNYVVAISKEAALRGFKEIHFDYIRFPDNAEYYNKVADYPGRDGKRKDDNIHDFIQFAKEELEPYGVHVGAAVFGIITKSWNDEPEDIGQTWVKITNGVDIISPMIYPSHYTSGWYGYDYPDQNPYGVFHGALSEAILKNAAVKNPAQIRPWIQAFTADWVDGHIEYTPEVTVEQIKASREFGIDGYLVWNAVNEYDPRTYLLAEKIKLDKTVLDSNLEEYNTNDIENERQMVKARVVDLEGTSPYQLVKDYFNAINDKRTNMVYLLTSIDSRPKTYQEFEKAFNDLKIDDVTVTVNGVAKEGDSYSFKVDLQVLKSGNMINLNSINLKVIKENGVFKLVQPNFEVQKQNDMEIKEDSSKENN